jgi:hypothetical protein
MALGESTPAFWSAVYGEVNGAASMLKMVEPGSHMMTWGDNSRSANGGASVGDFH